jgi:hypothetical protein
MLIDGVKDQVVKTLTKPAAHSTELRTLGIDTAILYELMQEYIEEYFEMYVPKAKDADKLAEILGDYIFNDMDKDDCLDKWNVTLKDFDYGYSGFIKGFRELYEDDYA